MTGGTAPFTFAVTTGTLPAGLTLDPATGLISGTPTAVGSSPFTVTATDADGLTAAQAYTLAINATLAINQATLPNPEVGAAYSQQLTVTGGAAPITFAVTAGTLPAGLTLDTATGLISGTPTTAGPASFTITATDANSASADQAFTVTVKAGPVIDQTTLPATTSGIAYLQQLTVTGGTTPYSFSVTTGTLPAGLTLSNAGLIAGTPTAAGTSDFTVTVTDAGGASSNRQYSLVINATPTLSPATLAATTIDATYSQQLTVTGKCSSPFTFSVTTGTLCTCRTGGSTARPG